MRHFVLIFIFLNITSFACAQTNPEDIIIRYNSDGSREIIDKRNLSMDPDSVDSMLFHEAQGMYAMKLDSLDLVSKLTGKWIFESAKRTNGKDINWSGAIAYEFKMDGAYVFMDKEEKITGRWSLSKIENAGINLAYDEPKVMIKDKNLLKYMDDKTIKSLTFSSEMISLAAIDSKRMTIRSSTIIGNPKNIDNTFYRIVLLYYVKTETD